MLVEKEQEDAQTQDPTTVALLWIQEPTLEEDVTFKTGLNLLKIMTDMIEYLRINVQMLTVGNLMTIKALINVWMEIMR